MFRNLVNKSFRAMGRLVYPPSCQLCLGDGDEGRDICRHCADHLPRNRPACPLCGEPMPSEDVCCGSCITLAPPFDRVYAPFLYDFPLQPLITALKFHHRLALAVLLAQLLGDELERQAVPKPDLLIPVPLHPQRLRQRGYNQALELARPLGRRFAIPIDWHSCERGGTTQPLSSLDRSQRRRAIRGAFRLRAVPTAGHVVIVDDVVTTGSTVGELARVLRAAGVAQVDVWALARTPMYPRRP